MPVVTSHIPGMFSYADLVTNDFSGARGFYTKLFGWEASPEMPTGDGGVYASLMKDGRTAVGLMGMSEQMREAHVPPSWNAYVTVENADAVAAKAKNLGGNPIFEPFDVMDAGRMAAIQDPTGAVFCIWQPKAAIGAEVFGESGALCWTELYTSDTAAAASFYESLFGWDLTIIPMQDGQTYSMFQLDGEPVAGMMAIRTEWGGVPPNWSVYLGVEDIHSALTQTKALGGSVELEPVPVPDIGTFALLKDPQGGYFLVFDLVGTPGG